MINKNLFKRMLALLLIIAMLLPSTEVFAATTKYKIIFKGNAIGVTNLPKEQIKTHNKTLILSKTKPVKTGHSFQGWSTSSGSTYVSYKAGAKYTENKARYLYAIWRKNTYTISYNANGGKNPPLSQTKTYGVDLTLRKNIPTKSGYIFVGWSTNRNAKTASYSASGIFKTNATTTLYAIWRKPKTYKIKYNANGGTGVLKDQTKTEGAALRLSKTKPSRTGHIFKGWSLDKKATKASYFADGTFSLDKAATLYAVWEKQTYTVTYKANRGSGGPVSQTKTYGTDLKLSTLKPTRTGYIFLGWATTSTATKAAYLAGGKYTKNASITLYAVWRKAAKYTITYNANGGTNPPKSQTKTEGVSLTLQKTKPTKTGYTFLGWATSSTAKTYKYAAGAQYTENKKVTLYAVWEKTKYTIKYDANGGKNAPSQQTKTYGTDLKLRSAKPTLTGHIFLGWATSSTAKNATYSASGVYKANKATTLYAIWKKAATYTVKYNANGGKNPPSSQTKTEGTTLTLSKTKPTRAGYTFKGWGTSSTATTVAYKAGASYTTNGGTTLYAIWKKTTYAIKYDANGGSGAPAAQTKTHGKTLVLSKTKPSRRGYIFLGWSTSSTATKKTYSPGDSYATNSAATLYAVWKAQGGTWTSGAGYSTSSHVYKKVYMPKNIATEYYMVLSDQTTFGWIAEQAADLGIPAAAGIIAAKLGISTGAAAAAATTAITLIKYSKFMNERNLKDVIKNCPQNGFVVIEFWQIKNLTTGQMVPTIMHENATSVNSGGKFQAGVYSTN